MKIKLIDNVTAEEREVDLTEMGYDETQQKAILEFELAKHKLIKKLQKADVDNWELSFMVR